MHFYKRSVFVTPPTLQPSLGYGRESYSFYLSMLPNYAEFGALYDEYMIKAVQVKFTPHHARTTVPVGMSGNNQAESDNGVFITVIDYDDNDLLSGFTEAQQYWSYKSVPGNITHSRYLKPKFLVQTYATATSTGYQPRRGWIDMANADVPHYGLKTWITSTAAQFPNIEYRCEIKYYLAFRGFR